ncbi:MBL fold metallo-hydrolase [Treponema sp. OttesenSCG-928-L16]|nr:MBL fold metallo-hydrolase [Treponema sp. OttesenSCG-928-L16]
MQEHDRWYKRGEELLSEIRLSRPGPDTAMLWFLGQCGFVIKIGGTVLYIDVILNDLLDDKGQSRRRYPPPFPPGAAQAVDYYLCTHDHIDHLNPETIVPLSKANPLAKFIVPAPVRNVLLDAGIPEERILAAKPGAVLHAESGDAEIIPLAAAHTDYSYDETGASFFLCYIIKGSGCTVFHAGDTIVRPELIETLKRNGPLDIAILPINGSDWERTAKGIIGNMGVCDAVKLARAVNADMTIPVHYDMMPVNGENPALFADCMYRECPSKKFHIFALGEAFMYSKKGGGSIS